MNWGAGVLLIIGAIIIVIGFSGSQNAVCQAVFGGKCLWLPGKETLTPVTIGTQTPGLGKGT
jgi:hypothetical protein